jgi:Arm domain-containing DNA-binding protein/integrase-like protein
MQSSICFRITIRATYAIAPTLQGDSVARAINRLSARSVTTIKEPGMHADGGGLYLRVTSAGSKQWVFIYRWLGRRREMGFGGTLSVTLARAREKAAEARALVADGLDPLTAKRAKAAVPTFAEVADEFIANRETILRSDKSVARVKRILGEKGYAAMLRPKLVNAIDTEDVLEVLKPIWAAKGETAAMARGYIEGVLNAAKAKGFRSLENPAVARSPGPPASSSPAAGAWTPRRHALRGRARIHRQAAPAQSHRGARVGIPRPD